MNNDGSVSLELWMKEDVNLPLQYTFISITCEQTPLCVVVSRNYLLLTFPCNMPPLTMNSAITLMTSH